MHGESGMAFAGEEMDFHGNPMGIEMKGTFPWKWEWEWEWYFPWESCRKYVV